LKFIAFNFLDVIKKTCCKDKLTKKFFVIFMRNIIFSLTLMFSASSFAARPFMTDDARLTTAESCQLESWTRIYKNSTEKWALPACNPTGNFEITAGGGHTKNAGEPATNDYVLQGKSLFRDLTTNGYGWGLAVGRINHPSSIAGPTHTLTASPPGGYEYWKYVAHNFVCHSAH
jgi:hypothetical protein